MFAKAVSWPPGLGMPAQPQLIGLGRSCGNTPANSEAMGSRTVTRTFDVCQSIFRHDCSVKLDFTAKRVNQGVVYR